jgi:AraC family transcriptional regulator
VGRRDARDDDDGEPTAARARPDGLMSRILLGGEFHGTRRETARIADLTLAETVYEPGHRLPHHAHDRPFFSLLVRGSFREDFDGKTRECGPTSLVFYPEHEPHREEFGPEGGRSFHVEIGRSWLERMRSAGSSYDSGSRESLHGRLNLLMVRLHAWFLQRGPSFEAEETVLEMLADVTSCEGLGSETRPPAWLARMRERIHADFRGKVRVTELADEAGIHPVHAARVFRRHHRCTIAEYVHTLRIEYARMCLADPDRSLSGIAISTGFADQAHFTRRFKAMVGVTPGSYRSLVGS